MKRLSVILLFISTHLFPVSAQQGTGELSVLLDTVTVKAPSSITDLGYKGSLEWKGLTLGAESMYHDFVLQSPAIADSTIKLPLLKTIRDDFKEEKRRNFDRDSLLSIKVATMDSVSYSFWKEFSNSTISSHSSYLMSSSTSNLPTNISGGIGYWCGYNSRILTFTVTPGTYK